MSPTVRLRPFAGVSLTIGVAIAVAACSGGPGSAPGTAASSVAGSPPASPTAAPSRWATPRPTASPTPVPTPSDSTVDGAAVRTLNLDSRSAPIDVAAAFGSLWIANHHRNTATRVDPTTMAIQASVDVGSGPGWFLVTDDALWVSNQMGQGLTRIDPQANTATTKAGKWPTCAQALFAFGSIWQTACDAHRVMRIDPKTFVSVDLDTGVRFGAARIGDRVYLGGPSGLAWINPKTGTLTAIGGPDTGRVLSADATTIWTSDERQILRIRPRDGAVVATLPIAEGGAMVFEGGRGWITSAGGLVEVDPATNKIVRTIGIGPCTGIAHADGALWVTSYDANTLRRIEP